MATLGWPFSRIIDAKDGTTVQNMLLEIDDERKDRPAGRIRQQNEAIILRAAEVEFARYGFKGASMNDIAQRAGLPKANIHYYFKNKLGLYLAVLRDIVALWDRSLNACTAADDPKQVLTDYIARKVRFSHENPLASRIFATEMVSGAPNMKSYFSEEYSRWFDGRIEVFKEWARQGKIDPQIKPEHLIFLLWSSTQHYADFSVQINAALGKEAMSEADYQDATETLTRIVLTGCGIH